MRCLTTRPVLSTIGMTLVLSLGSAFPAPWASAQPSLPIKIGYLSGPDWLMFAARDLKTFEQEGLAPAYVRFEAGPPVIAAAESQSIDVSAVGIVPFVLGISQGVVRSEEPPKETHRRLPVVAEPVAPDTVAPHRHVDAELSLPCDDSGARLAHHPMHPWLPHHGGIDLLLRQRGQLLFG